MSAFIPLQVLSGVAYMKLAESQSVLTVQSAHRLCAVPGVKAPQASCSDFEGPPPHRSLAPEHLHLQAFHQAGGRAAGC